MPSEDLIFPFKACTYRRIIKSIFDHLFPGINLSTHSFRKGAAQSAVHFNVPDYQIKAMERWRSDCYQCYTAIDMRIVSVAITTRI